MDSMTDEINNLKERVSKLESAAGTGQGMLNTATETGKGLVSSLFGKTGGRRSKRKRPKRRSRRR